MKCNARCLKGFPFPRIVFVLVAAARQCLEAVYSSDRVSEEVVMSVEETLRTAPEVQKMFLQVRETTANEMIADRHKQDQEHAVSLVLMPRRTRTRYTANQQSASTRWELTW